MKTTLSLVVTLIFGAMLLVSFQNGNTTMTAEEPQNTEAAEQQLIFATNPLVSLEEDSFFNEPDPFCGITTIYYRVKEYSRVTLSISCPNFGLINLVNADHKPGMYSVEFDACNLPCGDYYAYLITDYGKFKEPMKKIASVQKPPYATD